MTDDTISDADGARLLELWRAGNREAGEAFARAYFAVVLRFFRNKVPSDPEVDSLVGKTFEECLTSRATYRGTGSLVAWILGVARNTLYRFFRKKKNWVELPDEASSADVDDNEPVNLLIKSDNMRLVLKALRRIPLVMQSVIEMRAVEGLKFKDIAEAVDAPLPTVTRRWQRGLEALKAKMKQLESSPEEFAVSTHSLESWIRDVKARHPDEPGEPDDDKDDKDDEDGA